jgi:hypothetical protein
MYRATAAYALMMLLAGAALWAILSIGSRLTAPADLAGVWSVAPSNSGHNDVLGTSFSFKQSGRFAMLCLDGRDPIAFTLVKQGPGRDAGSVRLDFEGRSGTLTAIGAPGGDDFDFSLTGSLTAQCHAHRTWRAYPPAPTAEM